MKKRSNGTIKKKTVRMDETLIVQIEHLAASEERSFNWMMNEAAKLLVETRMKKKRRYTRKNVTQEKVSA